jgi:hypothetical protein
MSACGDRIRDDVGVELGELKAAAMMKTPKRWPKPPFSLRKLSRRSRGAHRGSPLKTTVDEDETIIPVKLVMVKPIGMVMS